MHFLRPLIDDELLRELSAQGVLRPEDRESMEHAAGSPESGTLNELLLAGAAIVSEERWLTWLIRGYNFPRVRRIVPDGVFIKEKKFDPARIKSFVEANSYPCRSLPNGGVVVAVGRPDLLHVVASALAPQVFEPMAATLTELKALRSLYEQETAGKN